MTDRICSSDALNEKGLSVRFEHSSLALPAFVIRYEGKVYAYQNRCPHRGTELDWEPGEVLDGDGEFLICATHGALFQPTTGLCVMGPCKGASLQSISVVEADGSVTLIDV
jgi:nitrite reductase/ring-hydroxylating ferredoxin subunit